MPARSLQCEFGLRWITWAVPTLLFATLVALSGSVVLAIPVILIYVVATAARARVCYKFTEGKLEVRGRLKVKHYDSRGAHLELTASSFNEAPGVRVFHVRTGSRTRVRITPNLYLVNDEDIGTFVVCARQAGFVVVAERNRWAFLRRRFEDRVARRCE